MTRRRTPHLINALLTDRELVQDLAAIARAEERAQAAERTSAPRETYMEMMERLRASGRPVVR